MRPFFFVCGAALIVGCNPVAKEAPLPPSLPSAAEPSVAATVMAPSVGATAVTPSASVTPVSSGVASVVVPGKAACVVDNDCRTVASYCAEAPCACRAVTTSFIQARCLGGGPQVKCFVDPCMKKAARCQNGTCALTIESAVQQ